MSHAAPSSMQDTAGKQAQRMHLFLAVIPRQPYHSFPLYWLQCPPQTDAEALLAAAREILTDPLQEELWHASSGERQEWMQRWQKQTFRFFAERQLLPGVTDNLGHTVEEGLGLKGFGDINVSAGRGFLFLDSQDGKSPDGQPSHGTAGNTVSAPKTASAQALEEESKYQLFHPLTDRFAIHDLNHIDESLKDLLSFPSVTLPAPPRPLEINLDVSDEQLLAISKERLLALTKQEMRAISQHFAAAATKQSRKSKGLPPAPTDVELEVIAQTWSEHCKHKIFNAKIAHTDFSQPIAQQRITIKSLYKTFIQKATFELMKTRNDLLSVFEDNSGVVKWDDEWAVCFKVETHNSPSALEPYGGALTGILGVNRDVLGTGLGARPLFNTDVFCFAYPSSSLPVRPKLLPAKVIINGVRKGVEDGGNKSGIPTVNGAIYFDPGYRAKPLVFCGTGGILPIKVQNKIGYQKHTRGGDTIVMAGGRVGKDGVHGATFSSESLHEGSPVSAVQIGDPFTQKRLLDFVVEARDQGLITGITDNGAGGLSSSVGEMARITNGASIELDRVPTKYPGLSDWEIVVSESQERMTISTDNMEALSALAKKHSVEVSAIGSFNDSGHFEIKRGGQIVGLLDLNFLHDGVPVLELESEWRPSQITMNTGSLPGDLSAVLLSLLAHPNIASKEQVIRQYDHEVQGLTVIKPLMGPRQSAPCDAAVLLPKYGDKAALVISNGMHPRLSSQDCYLMAQCAVDEAIRNAVCVGADPESITLLDNFCWPDPVFSPQNPQGKYILAQLVRTCQGLYNAVTAYGAPLISGKDSMKNDFDDGVVRISIPPTLLISAMGKVPDVEKCVSMEFKQDGDLIYLLAAGTPGLGGSHYEELGGWQSPVVPVLDLEKAVQLYRLLHQTMQSGWVNSAHDLSEGGLAVAVAECMIGSGLGARLDLDALIKHSLERATSYPAPPATQKMLSRDDTVLFGEGPAHLLITIDQRLRSEWESCWSQHRCILLGTVTNAPELFIERTHQGERRIILQRQLGDLEKAWKSPLPFD